MCTSFFDQNIAKHKPIYMAFEIFRYNIIVATSSTCSYISTNTHTFAYIATVCRATFWLRFWLPRSPLLSLSRSLQAQISYIPVMNINNWKLLESLAAILLFKTHIILRNHINSILVLWYVQILYTNYKHCKCVEAEKCTFS